MLLSNGKFAAHPIVESVEYMSTSKKQTPYISVTFELDEGPDKGKRIEWSGWLTPKSALKTYETMRLMGCRFPSGDIYNMSGIGTKSIVLVLEDEEYEGKTSTRVKYINSAENSSKPIVNKSSLAETLRSFCDASKKPGDDSGDEKAPF